MTIQELERLSTTHKRLMTRSDFVGMYRCAHSTLARYIKSGDIEIHLIGTIIHIDADEALAVTGNPKLRHSSMVNDLFA
jgi:hypothetical protein